MASVSALPLPDEVEYPESDGEPMAESDVHREDLTYLVDALSYHFRDQPEVYVSGNLLVYYEEGNPAARVAPDVFVVHGVPRGRRRTYLLWQEGRAPQLVIELTSKSTRQLDEGKKAELYADWGVEEYFLFDPLGEYLEPRLQGRRLRGGKYRRLRPAADGSLRSRVLGMSLLLDSDRLRLVHTASGEKLLRFSEVHASRRAAKRAIQAAKDAVRIWQEATAREAAEARADREAAARQALEEEVAGLRRKLSQPPEDG